ncbi:MAG: hypothetical protein PHP08_00185 [Candidatus Dojkabacteria bacterium]|nr:hypothetical protein [Candidatus Dojkabacteria bacterium]
MVLENPTKSEKRRFEELQKKGFLPSEALKKLETERRLGIIPEEPKGFFKEEDWWFWAISGALGAAILFVYIKGRTTAQSQQFSLENVEGIDLYSLNIAKQKGLI